MFVWECPHRGCPFSAVGEWEDDVWAAADAHVTNEHDEEES